MNYNEQIIKKFDEIKYETYLDYLKKKFEKFNYICIFGLGSLGKILADTLVKEGLKVSFFCDNDKSKVGNVYSGIECISIEELEKKKEDTLIIIETVHYKEIYNQLIDADYKNLDRILMNKIDIDKYIFKNDIKNTTSSLCKLLGILEDEESERVVSRIVEEWINHDYNYGQLDDIYSSNQYFIENLIELSDKEIFLDGGSYIGDTIDEFLKASNYKFDKIIAFELNKNIYNVLQTNIEKYHKDIKKDIKIFNLGLSDSEKEIYYDDYDAASSISSKGKNTGKITSIDSVLDGEKVSFIKMDIEGSEMEALRGAEFTIKKYKPKLAICLYHKPQDLWEIPLLIKEMVPEYKIFIRHHTDLLIETVCYAIPK